MKKTYINPTTKVVQLKPARLLAGSDPKYQGTTDRTSGNLAREFEFDDEEDW